MKIDEACINHNALRLIDDVLVDPYSWCYHDKDKDDGEETFNCMLMSMGEINGVLAMAKAMKEVLKA